MVHGVADGGNTDLNIAPVDLPVAFFGADHIVGGPLSVMPPVSGQVLFGNAAVGVQVAACAADIDAVGVQGVCYLIPHDPRPIGVLNG